MTPSRRIGLAISAVALLALLTACDPGGGGPTPTPDAGESGSPSATPTATTEPEPEPEAAPARADLALSPDGMGTLVFGETPSTDPATQMLVLDPEYCLDSNAGFGTGFAPGDPQAALWVPIPAYRDGLYADFGAEVGDEVLLRLDLLGNDIPTTAGIRIGDHRDEVTAAYPGAAIVEEWGTDIYVVPGDHGILQIEVARQPTEGGAYWEDSDVGYVKYIHAVETTYGVFTVAASENIAGICPF